MHVWLPLIETGTGSEVWTRNLAVLLRERGHTVSLDTARHAFQYCPWLAGLKPPAAADVVVANSWNAAAFARADLPLISVCHLVVHDPVLRPFKSKAQAIFHSGFVRPMERAAVRRAAVNVAVSPIVSRQMHALLGASDVLTVANGIDTDFWTPGSRRPRDRDEPFELLFVGKPSLRKGFDIVAKVVERLGPGFALRARGNCRSRHCLVRPAPMSDH